MPHVAFVTYQARPDITRSDLEAAALLLADDISVSAAPWDDETVDWWEFDAIVLRSCWNYHHQPEAFAAWLERLQRLPIINPLPLVRWNMDKRYLLTLAELGLPVVPTIPIDAGDERPLAPLVAEHGWQDAVIKPIYGAGADGIVVWRTSEPEPVVARTVPLLVQPRMAAIEAGERSLIFFCGAYSHAVIKYPAAGGTFVQEHHGGVSQPWVAPPAEIAMARRYLEAAATLTGVAIESIAYARVDAVADAAGLVLMELELIEPSLFLAADELAGTRFAQAILDAFGSLRPGFWR